MKHPHRLVLLCGGWLIAAMAAAVLAHAEAGRSSAPANECPKCPVCPIAQGQVITPPSYGSSIPVKKKISTDPVTPVCLPQEYSIVVETAQGTLCEEWYGNIPNKWGCIIDNKALQEYAGPNFCASGYTMGSTIAYSYMCKGGSDSTAPPTCGDNGTFIVDTPVTQYIGSTFYYTCKREYQQPDGQDSVCGPFATSVDNGKCCVVLPKK